MTHQELIRTSEYWVTHIQYEFFCKVSAYLEEHQMSRADFAAQLGVSKSYITQILNGNANLSLEKLIEISLSMGYYPEFTLAGFENEEAAQTDCIEELLDFAAQYETENPYMSVCTPDDYLEDAKLPNHIKKLTTEIVA